MVVDSPVCIQVFHHLPGNHLGQSAQERLETRVNGFARGWGIIPTRRETGNYLRTYHASTRSLAISLLAAPITHVSGYT